MTPEEILELDAEDLEKLTDEQFFEYIKPYLETTRPLENVPERNKKINLEEAPDLVERRGPGKSSVPRGPKLTAQEKHQKKLEELAARYGVDIDKIKQAPM